jgi:hypothetical protein
LAVIMVRIWRKRIFYLVRNLGCKTSRCFTNCCCWYESGQIWIRLITFNK